MIILIAYSCLNSNHLESVGMDFVHKYCSVGDCKWNIENSLAIFNFYKLCWQAINKSTHLIFVLPIEEGQAEIILSFCTDEYKRNYHDSLADLDSHDEIFTLIKSKVEISTKEDTYIIQ